MREDSRPKPEASIDVSKSKVDVASTDGWSATYPQTPEGLKGLAEAVAALDGPVLILAGAGTGKTKTLVERCCSLLEGGCALDEILMVTFTEAAERDPDLHGRWLRDTGLRIEGAAAEEKEEERGQPVQDG